MLLYQRMCVVWFSNRASCKAQSNLHFLQHLPSILWAHLRVIQLFHRKYLHSHGRSATHTIHQQSRTYRLVTDPLHLVNHAKAPLADTADDLVLAQLFDTSIAVDAQSVGLAWFARHR
jgi:hypothetical protein